jgi:hypothetical protein
MLDQGEEVVYSVDTTDVRSTDHELRRAKRRLVRVPVR